MPDELLFSFKHDESKSSSNTTVFKSCRETAKSCFFTLLPKLNKVLKQEKLDCRVGTKSIIYTIDGEDSYTIEFFLIIFSSEVDKVKNTLSALKEKLLEYNE